MAVAVSKRKQQQQPQRHCSDCSESYDWHEIGADGKPYLCRCKFKKEGGKYSIFLDDKECENFKQRI